MKNVVITGSTKGIGFGYAREFLKRGHRVCISGRSEADITAAIAKLQPECKDGARVVGFPCDMGKIADVEALWTQAAAALDGVDIWINNAGYARSGAGFLELTPAEMKTMVESNVIGTMNGSQVAMRGMTKQGHGHIFNTLGGGSDGRVVPGMIGYSTTKRAVRYFTDSLIDEVEGTPVRVGKISPGINVTEGMIRELMALPAEARKRAAWPLNVLGDHVETTTPWLVDRMLADVAAGRSGTQISWMTGGKVMGRFLTAPFTKRDLFSKVELTSA
jgi:NAD(P)-dependent dehydrogenase (short-subunit alcohol dehydrogenase family)